MGTPELEDFFEESKDIYLLKEAILDFVNDQE